MNQVTPVQAKVGDSAGLMSMNGVSASQLDMGAGARAFNAQLTLDSRAAILSEMWKNKITVDGKRLPTNDDLGNQSLFFSRSLEYLMASAFDVEYEELPFRKLFPVVNEGGPGTQEIVAEVYDRFGKAKLINQGAQDIPFVAAGGKEIKYPVGLFGVGAQWNMQELHAHAIAKQNGRGRRSPQASRQQAAIRAIEESLNDQALFGTPEIGIPGFLDHPNIPRSTVAPGASTSTLWVNKTADEILDDINALGDGIWVSSKMIEKPNTLAIAPSAYTLLSQRRLDGRDMSIMKYLQENSKYFTNDAAFIPVNQYEGAGVGGTNMMTAYDRNEGKLRMEIPQEMQSLPTQQQLFQYMMLYYTYSAGCMVLYPRSVEHADGI